MKIFFILVLVLNMLFEGAAGFALILGPEGAGLEPMPAGGNWQLNYGFAALAIASAIAWIWPYRTNAAAVGAVMGLLATFHIALTISLGLAGNQVPAMGTHGLMAVLCIVALTQRAKWCE